MLSDADIRAELDLGNITISPDLAERAVQPASLDVRLGDEFRVFRTHGITRIDPAAVPPGLTAPVKRKHEPFILHPDEFVLGTTYETVGLSAEISARVEGKSSLGRLGLLTHSTAGFIDPGFVGEITFELKNIGHIPIILRPGMKIGQLCFFYLDSPAEFPYGSQELGSHYQGQRGPTQSR